MRAILKSCWRLIVLLWASVRWVRITILDPVGSILLVRRVSNQQGRLQMRRQVLQEWVKAVLLALKLITRVELAPYWVLPVVVQHRRDKLHLQPSCCCACVHVVVLAMVSNVVAPFSWLFVPNKFVAPVQTRRCKKSVDWKTEVQATIDWTPRTCFGFARNSCTWQWGY